MVGLCKSYIPRNRCANITITSFTDVGRPCWDCVPTRKSTGFRLDSSLRVSNTNQSYHWFCIKCEVCKRWLRINDQSINRFGEVKHWFSVACIWFSVIAERINFAQARCDAMRSHFACIYIEMRIAALIALGHVQHRTHFHSFGALFICRYDLQATYKATWNTDLCITENLMENLTRCMCPLSGTYVVLMSKRNYNVSAHLSFLLTITMYKFLNFIIWFKRISI